MSIRQRIANLERVSEVSTLAGLNGKLVEERMQYIMQFELDRGRSQVVYVRDSSRDEGKKIITIFSPCHIVKKGFFSGLSKEKAIDLLRMNESIRFARYGIWEDKKEIMVVASIDHLLDTLDPDEFKASSFCVAMAADTYEEKHGKDNF
jgi:hypothetical protein